MKHMNPIRVTHILGAILSLLAVVSAMTVAQTVAPVGPVVEVPRVSFLTIEVDACPPVPDAVGQCPYPTLVVDSYELLVDEVLPDRTVTREIIRVDESTALEGCNHDFRHLLSDADRALLTHHNANPRLRITVTCANLMETFELPIRGQESEELLWSEIETAFVYASVRVHTNVPMPKITNIRFDPSPPATLGFNDRVTFTFDYTTTEPGGVYIWGTPFTDGHQSGGLAQHGSVLHPTGQGSLNGWFTIRFGAKTVDQVRFQMVDADRNVLYETMVNVDYAFGEAVDPVEPTGRVELVSVDPPLGSDLSMAEGVTFTVVVDYELAGVEGAEVFAYLELDCGTGMQIGSREVAAGAGVTSIVRRINLERARQWVEDRPNYEGILYLSVLIGYWDELGHRRILHRDSLLGPYDVER